MQLPKHIKYMVVEGVLGVGKSTLVNTLSKQIGTMALMEEYSTNPFLSKFYSDRAANAFQTQLFFLLSRHKQIKEVFNQQDMFAPQIISDYMFAKDQIFASMNLDENEMAIYNNLLPLLEKELTKPDYIVYLQANTEILLERISARDRIFERNMDENYIDTLNECYNSYFLHYTDSPLLIINTNEIDFVKNPDDFHLIKDTILDVPSGTNYFSPVRR